MPKIYLIEGNPVPLARPRFNRNTLHIYDSQKEEKMYARLFLENQHGNDPFYTGPLALYATFFMPIPKTLAQKKRLAMDETYHSGRPDLDNMLKWISDLANDVLFQDDALIALISGRKVYSLNPRTTFTLLELDHEHRINHTQTTSKKTT